MQRCENCVKKKSSFHSTIVDHKADCSLDGCQIERDWGSENKHGHLMGL